ncbi:hypothetical protein ASD80_14420 [Devosia sp. Root635]|nr:hypothetical protein ASD80_14420 [Devosia sp. Root635]
MVCLLSVASPPALAQPVEARHALDATLTLAELGLRDGDALLLAGAARALAVAPLAVVPPPSVRSELPLHAKDLFDELVVAARLAARGERGILDLLDGLPEDAAAETLRLPLAGDEKSLSFERQATQAGSLTLRALGRGTLSARLTDANGAVICEAPAGRDSLTCALPAEPGALTLTFSTNRSDREALLVFF